MADTLTRETEMGGMFFDSGRLCHSSLRTYPSSGCIVCKNSNVIRTARLIRNVQQRIKSVHYMLVHMFRIAIRLVRLIRKR